MELLLAKPVVVTLALLGALLSSAASFLQVRGYVSIRVAKGMNWAGYGAMGASMLLFVLAGLWR
jgi:hypothetical protein